jgi:hypothetical protein
MSGTLQRFVYNGVEVLHDSQKITRQVIVDSNPHSIAFTFASSETPGMSLVYMSIFTPLGVPRLFSCQ